MNYLNRLRSLSLRQWLRILGLSFAGLSVLVLLFGVLLFGIGLIQGVGSVVSQSFGEVGSLFAMSALSGLYVLFAALSLGAVAAGLMGLRRVIALLERLVDDADRRRE